MTLSSVTSPRGWLRCSLASTTYLAFDISCAPASRFKLLLSMSLAFQSVSKYQTITYKRTGLHLMGVKH